MNIIRIIAITFVGLIIMMTPMAITTALIIAHDPINLMGGMGAALYALSLLVGIGLMWAADKALQTRRF